MLKLLRVVTFKLDHEILEVLDRYAKEKRKHRSEVIREAIIRFLREEGVEIPEVRPKPRRIPLPRWWVEWSRSKEIEPVLVLEKEH